MKILNIHGYKGSAENSACTALKNIGHEVISPQIDYDLKNPRQILRDLRKIFSETKPDYIVGTSLGGFFAMLIARRNTDIPAVLVSPCLNPGVTLPELDYEMDKSRKMTFIVFADMIEKMNRHNITAIIGGQDEVIDYHDYTKAVIKNNYVVPDGKHSGATLNLDYWFRRLIK